MRTRCRRTFELTLLVGLLFSSSLSFSKSPPKKYDNHSKSDVGQNHSGIHASVEIFVGKDRDLIRQYFHNNMMNMAWLKVRQIQVGLLLNINMTIEIACIRLLRQKILKTRR